MPSCGVKGMTEGGLEVMGESLGERSFLGQDNAFMWVKGGDGGRRGGVVVVVLCVCVCAEWHMSLHYASCERRMTTRHAA